MKKYWIKDLTKTQVIHAPTMDIARKLRIKFYELGLKWANGYSYLNTTNWDHYREETCYFPFYGSFSHLSYYIQRGYEILTIDNLLDFQTNGYPKLMEVSVDEKSWHKRVVFMEKNGKFLAWSNATSIEESEGTTDICTWRHAREIQPLPTLELTIDQIAEKFNVSPKQIKIKK